MFVSTVPSGRDENGTDIFRSYSRPNPFRGVEICPYPSPDIQHPIPYPYPNTQLAGTVVFILKLEKAK